MTREWTDPADGHRWTVDVNEQGWAGRPVASPYVVCFCLDSRVIRAEYTGPASPRDLTDEDLSTLLAAGRTEEATATVRRPSFRSKGARRLRTAG